MQLAKKKSNNVYISWLKRIVCNKKKHKNKIFTCYSDEGKTNLTSNYKHLLFFWLTNTYYFKKYNINKE